MEKKKRRFQFFKWLFNIKDKPKPHDTVLEIQPGKHGVKAPKIGQS